MTPFTHRFVLALALLAGASVPATAQDAAPVSQCQAIAQDTPDAAFGQIVPVAFRPGEQYAATGDLARDEVRISFAGHSTYVVETPAGVSIATDYNGWSGHVRVPTVVTMNVAHSSHYTATPDPAIPHVLRGWGDGEPADHDIVVDDVYIRNVTTDIRSFDNGGLIENANSIFIFEVAGLCIGHLGHLHHELTDKHYTQIGRLDILMVPVDGGLTLSHEGMSRVVDRLYSSVILPMHRQGAIAQRFIDMMGEDFAVDYRSEPGFVVSMRTLPKQPTIVVVQGAM